MLKDKICPGCKKPLLKSKIYDYKHYYEYKTYDYDYICNCNIIIFYNENNNKIYIEEYIINYGIIIFTNNSITIDVYKIYKYLLSEDELPSYEIVEKYNEFKENLIFL